MTEKDREIYNASIKSQDTEEFFDLWFNRPIGFRCALFFRNRGIHPNVVTIISILLGVGAGVCFYQDSVRWNILGILLLMWANIYDSTDGQLARITGQKTRWGRILDGFAGDVWFFCIYFAIAVRTTFQPIPFMPDHQWGVYIWILCSFAGFWIHGSQCQLADYYRNIHLYFIQEKNGNEFDNSEVQRRKFRETPWRGNFFWKIFLYFYVSYTENQERMSPAFQRFIATVKQRYGTDIPQWLRKEFRRGSLPLMKYTNILTFNSRFAMLWLAMLTGELWAYLFFELVVLMAIFLYMQHKHEQMCKRLTKKIERLSELKNVKGIIFDYGGTIDTNGTHWAEVIWQAYKESGCKIKKGLFREAYVQAERTLAKHPIIEKSDTFRRLLEKKIAIQFDYLRSHGAATVTEAQEKSIVEICYSRVLSTMETTRDVVRRLSDTYPLLLVTNFYGNMNVVLEEFGLSRFFPKIVESSVVGLRKPDPALFALGVNELGIQAGETLVVGDSYSKDIYPSSTLGCRTAWLKNIGWKNEKPLRGAMPDITIRSLEELYDIL